MERFVLLKRVSIRNEGGFTLIEAMIALLIFAIGILATVSMQTTSLRGNLTAQETTEASTMAASVIENLRPLIYSRDPMLAEGTLSMPDQGPYSITYTVQRETIIDNAMLIQVTVNWTEHGRPRTVNLTYIKSDII